MKFICILPCALLLPSTVLASTIVTQAIDIASTAYHKRSRSISEFRIKARVVHTRRERNRTATAIVEDETGALVLYFPKKPLNAVKLSSGDQVIFEGILHFNNAGAPLCTVRSCTFLAHGAPVKPTDVTIDMLLDHKFDYRLTRVSGRLRDVTNSETFKGFGMLVITANRSRLFASVPVDEVSMAALRKLTGRQISLLGTCMPADPSPRLQIGRTFKVESPEDISPIDPPDTLSSVPDVQTIQNLTPDEVLSLGWHCATGHVIAVWHGNRAILRVTSGQVIGLQFAEGPIPKCGSLIKAIGLPESDLYHINLIKASWTELNSSQYQDPPPQNISVREISAYEKEDALINAYYHGKPIRLSGNIKDVSSTNRLLLLECENQIIPVDITAQPEILNLVKSGCQVTVSGICILEQENCHGNSLFPKLKSCTLAIRSPLDIKITSYPSWWTPKRLLSVISVMFAVLIGVFIWNRSLNRIANQRGRELSREQLGHVKADLKTEERTRLAVELHDTLAQNLTGVSMEIEAANDLRGEAPQQMLDHLDVAAKALKSCRDELRNCLWDLRSQALEETDMTKAVLKTLQPVVNDSRLAVRFNVPRARLSDNTAHALLRVIRELVINAIRHGNASSVKVAGTIDGDNLLCSVTDNGRGFDPEAAPGVLQGHFGLQGIQERIEELGGEFTIRSSCGKGTKATINIPIPHES